MARRDNATMLTNPGPLVYGTITVGALLAAESAQRETFPSTLGAVLVALTLYWLAHSSAEFTQRRAQHDAPLKLGGLLETMAHELSILLGASIPLLALLVCWVAGVKLGTAVTIATWTSAAMLVVIELAVGFRERLAPRDFAAQTALGILLGLLVIVLRTLLH
jgi:membrane protein YqaA with SNARE-associated domain